MRRSTDIKLRHYRVRFGVDLRDGIRADGNNGKSFMVRREAQAMDKQFAMIQGTEGRGHSGLAKARTDPSGLFVAGSIH